jgi:CheY-like chemotaxis protein
VALHGAIAGSDVAESVAHAKVVERAATVVLVVDDDPMIRLITAQMLEDAGFETLEAADGAAALTVLEERSEAIDAVLSDVMMPGMGGRELAAGIARRWPAIAVALMSGYSRPLLEGEGHLGPDDAFLPKPFQPDRLVGLVRRLLTSR